MVYEARRQWMAWMETDYSKRTHFPSWKIKWRLEHLSALGIMGDIVSLVRPFTLKMDISKAGRKFSAWTFRITFQENSADFQGFFLGRHVNSDDGVVSMWVSHQCGHIPAWATFCPWMGTSSRSLVSSPVPYIRLKEAITYLEKNTRDHGYNTRNNDKPFYK